MAFIKHVKAVNVLKKRIIALVALALAAALLLSIGMSANAAEERFKKGMAYLLSGAIVYADSQGTERVFQVISDTGVYVVRNATSEGADTIKANDMLQVAVAVDGKAKELYVWAYDIQYMSKKQLSNYRPAKGAGVYGVTLGNAEIADAPTPIPVVTRDPNRALATKEPGRVTPKTRRTATPAARRGTRRIDVWWRGRNQNGPFMLALARLMQQHGINIAALQSRSDALAAEAKTALYVASDGKALGLIAVADPIKPTSAEAIARLRGLGVRTIMLTGDQATTAEAVARQVGLDEVVAGVLPSDKEQKVRTLQEEGALVAMVGDGINDAPALARADVGIAIGAGTDIAISSADVVLMRSDLRDVATAIELSRATMRNIRQNLFWALFYNAICIPVAVGVLTPLGITLNPMIGAAAMGFSSVFVVSNALRLRTWKPSETVAESTTTNNPVVGSAAREDEGSTEMKAKTLKVEGMMCEHCVARVKDVLEKAGAKNVEVSLEEGTAKLEAGLLLSDAKLVKAVEDAGYKATMA